MGKSTKYAVLYENAGKPSKQSQEFIRVAKELGTNEDVSAFEENLRRIASVKPAHKPKQPKKRT